MKIIEKNSPVTRPRIVALVNRPLTQYRMRVPMVPSGPGTLSAWSAPRPFPRSIVETRPPISHHSLYSPFFGDSRRLPLPQFLGVRCSQYSAHLSESRLSHDST